MFANVERVLVCAAHADDEVIGLGGTIARLSRQGVQVVMATFTRGETAYPSEELKDRMAEIRAAEARATDRLLGISQRIQFDYPTRGLYNGPETLVDTMRLIRQVRPQVIFCHYSEDKHRDHRALAELIDEARWKATEQLQPDLGERWYTPWLLYFEVWELFTHPMVLVDISETYELKMKALRAQTSQLQVMPGIVQFVESVSRARGAQAGRAYAEAFRISDRLPVIV
ncbi:MAG TPA: hypothetical protein EYP04_00660 [Anaerolineae bacterium]|nr:hypothetical protein [Anaerolineae bacterium]HIQ06621.1 hypothetical protein [Anaerolineae bacterium]